MAAFSQGSGTSPEADGGEKPSFLLPQVYGELRRLAAHYLRSERADLSIQPTELVHEAWLRLAGGDPASCEGRAHFMALAATSMRRVLVDRARRKSTEKRGGGGQKLPLDDLAIFSPGRSRKILALDEALDRLATLSPRQGRVVELRFFGGLEIDEIAGMEGVSARTIKRDWSLARAWLHREIARGA